MSRRLVAAISGVVCAAALAAAAAVPAALAAPGKPALVKPALGKPALGKLTVSISGLPKHPGIVPGGAPLTFVVIVRNGTRLMARNITPVVAIDHCSCVSTPVELAPNGTLREFDSAIRKWRPVFYDRVGTGLDYLLLVQQRPFSLAPGASARFTFRFWLAGRSRQLIKVHSGRTGILVSVVRVPVNLSRSPVLTSTETPVAVIVR